MAWPNEDAWHELRASRLTCWRFLRALIGLKSSHALYALQSDLVVRPTQTEVSGCQVALW